MAGTNCADTVCADLCLTDSAEESHETKSQTYTEDGTSCRHRDFGSHFTVEHEKAYEAIQTL